MRWFIRSQAVQFAVDAATDVVVVIENASNADTVASAAAQLLSQLPQVIIQVLMLLSCQHPKCFRSRGLQLFIAMCGTVGHLSFHPMPLCAVHALKELALLQA